MTMPCENDDESPSSKPCHVFACTCFTGPPANTTYDSNNTTTTKQQDSPTFDNAAMVQFKRRSASGLYWKLDAPFLPTGTHHREKLKAKGYHFNKSSNAARMKVHISRADRGLMSYEKRSMAELRSFCISRKILMPDMAKSSATALVSRLESEDEAGTTFGQFLDLPPELRLLVYEAYFDDIRDRFHPSDIQGDWVHGRTRDGLCETNKLMSPPPVAQTCALVRKETIPLFAKSFRLNVNLSQNLGTRAQKRQQWNSMSGWYSKSFTKAPPHLLRIARRLVISGFVTVRGFRVRKTCEIDLPVGQQPLQVSIHRAKNLSLWPQAPDQLLEEVDSTFKKELDEFLEDMSARSNGMALELRDRGKIPEVWDRTMQALSALPN